MEIIIKKTENEAAILAAKIIIRLIRSKANAVLGLATGSTMEPVYAELVKAYQQKGIDFSQVSTFNLDEYVGLPSDHDQSYNFYMNKHLFNHININRHFIRIPDGLAQDIPAFCQNYEEQIASAGGIDIQLLGIGTDGHIGFNEPTSSLSSLTRIKTLAKETIESNARFFKNEREVPRHVLTMGVGTIIKARQCLMLAFGKQKASAVKQMVEGPITAMVPASILQLHPNTIVVVDKPAASQLCLKEYYQWVYENKPAWQQLE
jgi:glucosamine-6-phosphate deaminase